MIKLESLSNKELLRLHGQVLMELKGRSIVKTANNPIGDYAEWLVSKSLDYTLQRNSNSGFDALDKDGNKIQIKARRITTANKSTQLSAIRNLEAHDFDYLIAILFDENYELLKALKIPHAAVHDYSVYRKHVNGFILFLRGPLLSDPRIEDVTELLRSYHNK